MTNISLIISFGSEFAFWDWVLFSRIWNRKRYRDRLIIALDIVTHYIFGMIHSCRSLHVVCS